MPAKSLRCALAAASAALPLCPALPAAAQCGPQWNEGFEPRGPGAIQSLAVLREGPEQVLYAGGTFDGASDALQIGLARWDGSRWTLIPSDREAGVTRLAVYDDGLGGGPALFAAGFFRTDGGTYDRIRKWTGTQWLTLPHPAGDPHWSGTIYTRAVRTGSTEQLFAFGGFYSGSYWTIARWAGDHWEPVGEPAIGMIHDIVAFDAGDGPRLFAAGEFAGSLASFDGATWRLDAAGPRPYAGVPNVDTAVRRLEVFDPDADGPAPAEIIAAGNFGSIGGQQIAFIARWDGAAWRPLGAGVNADVTGLAVIDRGDGPRLYVGGAFTTAGGLAAERAAVWDGGSWSPLGVGLNSRVTAFVPFDDGDVGPGVAIGGHFTEAAGRSARGLAIWDGADLRTAGSTLAPHNPVGTMAVLPDAGGVERLAVVTTTYIGFAQTIAVRLFDGRQWTTIALADDSVSALAWADLGDGAALYAGGRFTTIGGVAASRIARWDGSAWSPLGEGIGGDALSVVGELAVFDHGSGPRLYAAGTFNSAGGIPAASLAAWDGAAWSVPTLPLPQGGIRAMTVYDHDGPGPAHPALYIGGGFGEVAGVAANRIARWDGTAWSALGSGIYNWSGHAIVMSLAVLDDDAGGPAPPALYVGGMFTHAGGVNSPGVARWDGAAWSAVAGSPGRDIVALAAAPPANPSAPGSLLMVMHQETSKRLMDLVRWSGGASMVLGEFVGYAPSIAALDHDGPGPGGQAVYVGGSFAGVDGIRSGNLARFSADGPAVFDDPRPRLIRPGATLRLGAGVSGAAPLAYQWRRAGQPLTDDGRITGAATPALSIRAATPADAGDYDLVVTSPCGAAASAAATVTLTCPADWNADGAATSADVAAFLTTWFLAAATGSAGADFDASGAVDSRDLSAYLTAWLAAVQTGC